jgi:hypothetical protein
MGFRFYCHLNLTYFDDIVKYYKLLIMDISPDCVNSISDFKKLNFLYQEHYHYSFKHNIVA